MDAVDMSSLFIGWEGLNPSVFIEWECGQSQSSSLPEISWSYPVKDGLLLKP